MSKKGTTKDEIFLVKLYELGLKRGDPQTPFDLFEIGRAIGQNDRGAKVIVRDLAQCNFIKKGEGDRVFLTPNGLRLVQSLLNE